MMKDFERIDRLEREYYFLQQILVRILDIQIGMQDLIEECVKIKLPKSKESK